MSRGDTIDLVVDSLAAGGDAVGRAADGRITFVPYAAPGDRATVRLTEEHRSYARAELLALVAPGPGRVEPPCPLFRARTCGGCQWQHLEPAAQAAAKQAICAGALRDLVAAGLELAPILTPAPPFRWRRRARLHWIRPRGAPRAIIGFFAPRSRRITDVPACPQVELALERALEEVRAALAERLRNRGEISVLVGAAGEVHLAIRGDCPRAAAESLVGRAGIAGVRLGGATLGAPDIELEPGLRGRADGFAQASLAGNRALLAELARAVAPVDDARILELYAGSGNLTRVLAAGAAEVVTVEERPDPAARAELPANVRAEVGRAEEVVRALLARQERFDVVVLDPPRTGAREVVAPLIELGPPRAVYVSCDPATLARDLSLLARGGYRPLRAQPIDLMPQTAHVEVVATLTRT